MIDRSRRSSWPKRGIVAAARDRRDRRCRSRRPRWATRSSASRRACAARTRRDSRRRLTPRGRARSRAMRSLPPREEPGPHDGPSFVGAKEAGTRRQRVQAPGAPHEHLPEPVVGADEPILDAERRQSSSAHGFWTGRNRPASTRNPRRRSVAMVPPSRSRASRSVRSSSMARSGARLNRAVRRREPGDASADGRRASAAPVSSRASGRAASQVASIAMELGMIVHRRRA